MKWIHVSDKLPCLTKAQGKPHALGVPVLVYPHKDYHADIPQITIAYYGRRLTNEACFYLHGSVIDPTHWMLLPKPPRGEG